MRGGSGGSRLPFAHTYQSATTLRSPSRSHGVSGTNSPPGSHCRRYWTVVGGCPWNTRTCPPLSANFLYRRRWPDPGRSHPAPGAPPRRTQPACTTRSSGTGRRPQCSWTPRVSGGRPGGMDPNSSRAVLSATAKGACCIARIDTGTVGLLGGRTSTRSGGRFVTRTVTNLRRIRYNESRPDS
jgi:hypothetical protein